MTLKTCQSCGISICDECTIEKCSLCAHSQDDYRVARDIVLSVRIDSLESRIKSYRKLWAEVDRLALDALQADGEYPKTRYLEQILRKLGISVPIKEE